MFGRLNLENCTTSHIDPVTKELVSTTLDWAHSPRIDKVVPIPGNKSVSWSIV